MKRCTGSDGNAGEIPCQRELFFLARCVTVSLLFSPKQTQKLFLERLEIQGFKSFADKVSLKFDRGNTAVVGPNGSGKSNIADAVRWVLGEQSLKMLRGKKSEDVIFAGSKARPQMSAASVSLHLNNDDKKIPLELSEVVITRKIYRNGESEYLINNSQVRLIDIVELLAKSGFGQKTYSVIGQGMIDAFITASPTERKILFEEAAGVKQYQLKRNQTLRKLEVTRQNLQRVRDLLNELKPRLRSLERQTERAEERVKIQKELKELQIKWFSFFNADIKAHLKDLNSRYIETEQHYQAVERDYKELEKKLQESGEGVGTDRKKYEELSEQLATEQRKKNELEGEIARLSGLIEVERERDYSQDQKTLSSQKTLLENERMSLRSSLDEQIQEKDRNEQLAKSREIEVQEIVKKITELREKTHQYESGQATQGDRKIELRGELKEITSAQRQLIHEIESCTDIARLSEIQDLAKEIEERLSALAHSLEDNSEASAKELLGIQRAVNTLLEEKDQKMAALSDVTIKVRTAENAIHSLTSRLHHIETELVGIEQKLSTGKSGGNKENITYLDEKKTKLEKELETINTKVADTRNALRSLDEEELERKKGFLELEKSLRARREELTSATQAKNDIEVKRARLEVRKEDLDREISEDIGFDALRTLTPEEHGALESLSSEQKDAEHRRIEHLQVQLTRIGGIDENVVEEHKEVKERFEFLSTQSEDLETASKDLHKVIEQLDVTIKKKFHESFRRINVEFDKFFKILFNGGTAKLSIVRPEKNTPSEDGEQGEAEAQEETALDEEDPTLKSSIEGVEIKANPPGKKVKTLAMLSGGEKAMTSIALLCAIIANNPSPFVVLDEVDAALDDANARRYARIISKLNDKTQFIVITHNHETMRLAQVLYGVTMQRDGVSKMLSIRLEDVKEGGNIEGQAHVKQD